MTTLARPDPGARRDPGARPGPAPLPAPAARLIARVRAHWRASLLVRAAVWAVAAAVGVAAGLVVLDLATDLSADARGTLGWAPLAAALVPLALATVRLIREPGDDRMALLAEERVPALGNALATAVTARAEGAIGRLFTARLDRALEPATGASAPRWLVRPGLRPGLITLAAGSAVLVLLALLAGGPAALLESWRRPAHEAPLAVSPGSPLERALSGADRGVVRIGALRWTSIPPGYTGLEPTEDSADEPIRALVGSGIVVRLAVTGPDSRWSVRLIGGDDAPVRLDEDRLEASFTMVPGVRALELEGRREGEVVARRVVPLAALPDEAPAVVLDEPRRDEVLGSAAGILDVRARATDDHGVADVRLGWIRSRGSGESFAFAEGEAEFERVGREEGAIITETELDLGTLGLRPGDVLHLRAIARDSNDVTGPGIGVSTTRVIRIAAEGEEHEVTSLIGAPPDVEERPVLSQRMIILMTERLVDEAGGMGPAEIAAEAVRIGREQGRLRARVGEILFVRSTGGLDTPQELENPLTGDYVPHGHADHDHVEGDEEWDASDPAAVLEAASRATGTGTLEEISHVHDDAPVIAVNRELLGAYNAMYDAERALRQAAADSALPPEYRALEILQRVREGDRVFVRGQVTVPPIDVAGARGTGELTGLAVDDRSTAPPATALSAYAALDEAAGALELPPQRAALIIASVTARLLSEQAIDAEAATLLSRAATAAGDGRRDDAVALLARARARLEPAARSGKGSAPPRSRDSIGSAYQRLLRTGTAAAGAEGTAPADAPSSPGTGPFTFATARYNSGDWDSAPLVAANLTHSMAQYTAIPVEPEPAVVDLDSDEVFDHPFLFLTGHLPVRFTPAETRNLRAFVERGGFLFIDDHNHDIDAAFHRTVTAELARIFGDDALAPLPNDHELYGAFFRFDDGPPTTTHELNGWGDGLIHEQLQAIQVDGRIGVLYSNKDYASEWNYHAVNKRFQSLDNTRFGVNILVYALTR